ncbi:MULTISPECIES: heparan-alpha-glucosaminide N-acetyltransferase domain-containing protein [Corallococcus]|uniref:heparan-alpha-glucosaminide N-acetyltransferase domain-containing protein n=1 Tax=Corallococcus TaxID=83461 RepID=UPI00131509BB|nr:MULTISPECIES: heparan-alpha-glucosaminide N-acetyltransferase domain-containing protein [Corallococcus]NPC73893.1 DUF1624 domain-containing protein [Corallococcus exiguus]NPD23745.1 DUF1624 domain-containing protein [Corallococcus exiguus]NRD47050.1 DUF1624 domain-containing protein [Corallococcus exiguus]
MQREQMPGARSASGRLEAVDAMRGSVMLLVFLSHFADAYLYPLGGEAAHLRERIHLLTRLATPGFMVISGLMLGLLYARSRDFGPLRTRLQRRGLFLLTAGHLLIVPTYRFWPDESLVLLRTLPVTDTLAVALLVGPWVVTRLNGRARAVLGLGLFALSWTVSLCWWPEWIVARTFKEVFFGQRELSVLLSGFPVVPWLGVYLVGSMFGEWLGTWGRADVKGVGRRFELVGLGIAMGGAALVVLHIAVHHLWHGAGFDTLMALTSQSQKYPPGPAYVALYGGTALALMGLLLHAEQAGYLSRFLRAASVIGRHSLLAFVLQFYVYYAGLYLLRLHYTPLWPLLFVFTAGLQWCALYAWDLRGRAREASARLPATVPVSGAR